MASVPWEIDDTNSVPWEIDDTDGGVGRQVGLTARAGLSGMAGLADMAASPFRYAMNTIANPPRNVNELMFGREGDPFGTMQQQVEASDVLPRPETRTERIAGKTAEAMASGAGFSKGADFLSRNVASPVAQKLMQMLADKPAQAMNLAGVSGAASQTSAEGGGGPIANIAAGITAPIAAVVAKQGVYDPVRRQLGQIIDAGFRKGGDTRAAGRVAVDVAGERAPIVASALRNADDPLTAAQGALPARSAEFSGLERIVGSQQPTAYAKDVGDIALARREYAAQGMKDLNAQLSPVREAILTFAEKSGKTNVGPIMGYINKELADPNTVGNTAKESALRYYANLLATNADEQTGQINAHSLYGVRKNAGLHLKGLAEKEGWDKKTTMSVTKDIQNLIDDQITAASGITTKDGGSAWKDQYMQPFSKEAQRISGLEIAAKKSDKLGSAGRKRATQISRIDEAPVQLPNPLMRSIMVINSIMRAAQGRGGDATTKRLAELMKPENKAELARLMDEELARQAAIPKIGESVSRAAVYGGIGAQ